ncbi:MAG: terminase large subunit [Chromatiales bacterium]|nr:terminase large subunit [Chromatiales bacterium]
MTPAERARRSRANRRAAASGQLALIDAPPPPARPRPKRRKRPRTDAERSKDYRDRKKAERAAEVALPSPPADPVGALAEWAASTLTVPPGHPSAGEPLALPAFALDWLRAGWGAHESALSVARKNGKSAIVAVLVLGHLVGPLRTPGWRGAVCSVSKEKAGELLAQIEDIATASRLAGLTVGKVPRHARSASGRVDILSADRTAGHASGFDLVVVDETGLMPERSRDLLAGLRSSVSARGGRTLHISVRGDSPLYREILANPAVVSHVYAAPDRCALDDESAWAAANPGLGTIKRREYMTAEVERIRGAPGDEPSFRAYDLNQALDPTREMVCSPDDLRACFTPDPPPRSGPALLGFDFGEATSATAAAAVWPETGRVETWMAFGDTPPLPERARRDDAPYAEMQSRGELTLHAGRVVSLERFLADVAGGLDGCEVAAAAADSYKDAEVRDVLDRARLDWPIVFRRVGAGKDGGRDVRAFTRLVLESKLRLAPNLSLATAIAKSVIRRDGNGNPALDRATANGRIDVLSAAVIACGLAEPHFDRPPAELEWFIA